MNSSIKFIKKPKLKNIYFIAAWPGMGEVAIKAASFLKKKLKFEEFAILDTPDFFPAQGVEIIKQHVSIPHRLGGKYYFHRSKKGAKDIVMFISDRQPPADLCYGYAKKVLEINNFFKIKRIFTFAAIPAPIDHAQAPKIFGALTKKGKIKDLDILDIKPMLSGQIMGLNGLLLGVADIQNIEGICLLSEIPFYTVHIENPRASAVVLAMLARILNINIELNDLFKAAKLLELDIDKLIGYFKMPINDNEPIGEDDISRIKNALSAYTKLPGSAKKSIDNLFKEVKKDISKANSLKQELDKWNVYGEYEDRFLDLFENSQNTDN